MSCSRTYMMPDGLLPRSLLLRYGGDTCVLVSFTATGENTVTASAALVKQAGFFSAIEELPFLIRQNN